MVTKVCRVCGVDKSIDDYYKGNGKCKSCRIEIQKKYATNNKDKISLIKRNIM